jgi:hypothetical protein
MKPQPTEHDLKNAFLFLELLPEMLIRTLKYGRGPGTDDFEELMEIYREKIQILKSGVAT